MFMMVFLVYASERVRSSADAAASALGKLLACEIAPSDGALAAATTTSSDFGRHRFMDSFKVTTAT